MVIQAGAVRMTAELPTGRDPLSVRRRIEAVERLLEGMIELPVLGRRVGLDAIAGVVPIFGDLVTAGMGFYLVWEGRNLGMSRWQLARMTGRVGFDALLGAVPVAGDILDLFYRSNRANLKTILRHLDRHHPETRTIEG